jgi:YVTN family beta-propeller protein
MRSVTRALLATVALWAAVPAATAAAGAPFCVVDGLQSNTLSVLDATVTPPTVSATVPVGTTPEGVAILPDARTAIVTNAGANTVSFVDTVSGSVVGGPLAVGSNPFAVAVTPDGRLAYVANILSDTVSVIDLRTRTVKTAVGVGSAPDGVAMSPNGAFVYVSNFNDNTISQIDTASQTVARVLPANFGPTGLVVTPDGKTIYVGDEVFPRGVTVIDITTGTVAGSVSTGLDPAAVALSPDGRFLALAEGAQTVVFSLPPESTPPLDRLPTQAFTVGAQQAAGVAFSPDGNALYVADAGSVAGGVTVVAMPGGAVVGRVLAGVPAAAIACAARMSVAMARFKAAAVIDLAPRSGQDRFALASSFVLGAASNGLDSTSEGVTLELGPATITVPASRIVRTGPRTFTFAGVVDGMKVALALRAVSAVSYQLDIVASQASLQAVRNPVAVRLTIGDDVGSATVTAAIHR